jgi:hypothetical protein
VVWTRTEGTVDAQTAALRLALGLAYGQRRPWQPGHSPDGHRPLDTGRICSFSKGSVDRGALRLRRRRQLVLHDYPTAPLIFEVRGLPASTTAKEMDNYQGAGVGVVIECEGGNLVINKGVKAVDKQGKSIKSFNGQGDHFENFLKAVRSRKVSDLNADILEGHLSSALCHTGNISYRLGKMRSPDEIKDALKSNSQLAEAFDRASTTWIS